MDGHTPNPNQFNTGSTYFGVEKDSSTFYTFKVTAIARCAVDNNYAYDEAKVFDGKTSQWMKIQTHTRADGVRVEYVQFHHTRICWGDQTAEEIFGDQWVAVSQEGWTQ